MSKSPVDIGYTILAQDQVSVAPLCGRFTIRAYHVSQMSSLSLVDAEDAFQDVSYTLPSACEDWVVTQQFKHATNESIVWLHNVVTKNSEQLIESSGNRNYILPKVSALYFKHHLSSQPLCTLLYAIFEDLDIVINPPQVLI